MKSVCYALLLTPLILGALRGQTVRLEFRKAIELEIKPGETHLLTIPTQTGDFVRGTLEQQGIGLTLRGLFPDGNKIRSFGGAGQAQKRFRFVGEVAGDYQLEIKAAAGDSVGRYRVEIEDVQPIAARLKLTEDEPQSPRLERLRRDHAAGSPGAVAEFWREVQQSGSPLAESIPNDPDNDLVTFLWRETFPLNNVLVIGPLTFPLLERYQMTRLGDSDVWFKSVPMPKGSRFHYQLSPNDTLSRAANAQRFATAQADPLNPRRDPADPGVTKYEVFSIAELPGAARRTWAEQRSDVASGKLTRHQFTSSLLDNSRTVTVYTPSGYGRDRTTYPLLVLFDGSAYLSVGSVQATLDNLIAARKIPPIVAAFFNTKDQATRTRELVCNPTFADAIQRELLPWLRKEYHIATDPSRTTIGGVSHGGLAAAYVAMQHPESFGNVLSQSGTFWWSPRRDLEEIRLRRGEEEGNWIAREFIRREKLPLRFFLEAGLYESDRFGSGGQILEETRRLRDVLRAKGYEVIYQDFPGGHHFINWRVSLADGLMALLGSG
jgi:enterochelin esterase-like enzyme